MDDGIKKIASMWMKEEGPESEVVLSSRIRLARNLKGIPFPYLASDSQVEKVLQIITKAVKSQKNKLQDFDLILLQNLGNLERYVLVEKHLISPLIAKESRNSAVLLRRDELVSIMINEEDHIRIQCIMPGLQLQQALEVADMYDDLIEAHVDYAFNEQYGYLTACPTNVGTGLRASVMLHLPALSITKKFNQIISALSKVGLAVRGMYGEGTDIIGNLVQISNQITLGQNEKEILHNLEGVTRHIIEQEQQARQALLNEGQEKLADRAGRAFGILKHAHMITTHEAMNLLSDVRLGVDLGLIKGIERSVLGELLVLIRPACLQYVSRKELSPRERDLERAKQIKQCLKSIKAETL